MGSTSGLRLRMVSFFIDPLERVQADAEQVHAHLQRVAQHLDARARVVAPGDGHLADRISHFARDEQRLDVKGPAADGDQREDGFGRVGAEAFEPALRVLQAGQEHQAHQGVEGAPDQVAVFGLVVAHRAGRLARGDGDGRVRQVRRQKTQDLFDGHRKVRVADEAELALRGQHALAHRPALAGGALVQQDEVGNLLFQPVHDLIGAVGAAVLHHDDLGAEGLRGQEGVDLLEGGGQALGFVVGRDDEGEQGFGCGWHG